MAEGRSRVIDTLAREEMILVLEYFGADDPEGFDFAVGEAWMRYERADGYRSAEKADLRERVAGRLLAKDAESWGYAMFEGDRSSALAVADEMLSERDDEMAALRATLARVDALHRPRWITEVRPCDAHLPYTSDAVEQSRTCPDCARRPVLVCRDIRCCMWPCESHLALHDETPETCAHRADESSGERQKFGTVEDGHGSSWEKCSADCGLQLVRPGKVQCNCKETTP